MLFFLLIKLIYSILIIMNQNGKVKNSGLFRYGKRNISHEKSQHMGSLNSSTCSITERTDILSKENIALKSQLEE